MSKALEGEHLCVKHQGNHSHYAENNCTICKLESQLSASDEARKKAEAEVGQLMQGRTNRGDSIAGTVKRFGVDATKLPLDVIPATNGAFVWFSDYEQLQRENDSLQAELAQLREELEEAKAVTGYDNSRGFSLWFSREEWGGIIDGVALEIERSGQRKCNYARL